MPAIKRIKYKNKGEENSAFEMVDLQEFMETRPQNHLELDYRISFWTLIYIIKGEGNHYIDFKTYPYKAGDLIVIRKNQVNHFEINKEVEGYIILINEPFFFNEKGMLFAKFFEFFENPYTNPRISLDTSALSLNRNLIDLLYKEYKKNKSQKNKILIQSLFQSFILSIQEYTDEMKITTDNTVFLTYLKFSKLVEANYKNVKTVEDYAKMMAISKKTINLATRKMAGLSAKQFISNRVVLEIKRYLSQGDFMNYEIADLLGFDEPANLTNFFKRYEGVSPSVFKDSLKR